MAVKTMLDSLENASHDARLKLETELSRIEKNPALSPVGKQDKARAARQVYTTTMAALKAQAQNLLDDERETAEKALRVARTAAAVKQRELLGTQATIELLRDELRAAVDGREIVSRARGAVDDWERAVITALGLAELRRRADAGQPVGNQTAELATFGADPKVAQAESAMTEIKQVETRLSRLDSLQYETDLARRYMPNTAPPTPAVVTP